MKKRKDSPIARLFDFKGRPTLGDILGKGKNNFDLIRLVAALMVIFGHTFAVHPSYGHGDPLAWLIGFSFSGGIAVCVFFLISGILITASYHNSNSPAHFMVMRFFRIWPALFVCVVFTVFVVGPVVSNLGFAGYFSSPGTWKYFFLTSVLKIQYQLPGVFDTNLIPHTVNGSLWTLPLEIKCYIGILLIGSFGLIRKRGWIIAVVAAGLASYLFYPAFLLFLAGSSSGLTFCVFFAVGVIVFYLRKYIILDYRILGALFLLWIALRFTPLYEIGFFIFLAYAVLMAACSKTLRKVDLRGDYSYGIYIYGYLTQQVTAHYLPTIGSYPSLLITMTSSIILGILSWHLLEKRALALGKRIHGHVGLWLGKFGRKLLKIRGR